MFYITKSVTLPAAIRGAICVFFFLELHDLIERRRYHIADDNDERARISIEQCIVYGLSFFFDDRYLFVGAYIYSPLW
jgi:hypothetical protein